MAHYKCREGEENSVANSILYNFRHYRQHEFYIKYVNISRCVKKTNAK